MKLAIQNSNFSHEKLYDYQNRLYFKETIFAVFTYF